MPYGVISGYGYMFMSLLQVQRYKFLCQYYMILWH